MKKNEWHFVIKTRNGVARREWKSQGSSDRKTKCFNELQVTFDRMSITIDARGMMIKKVGTFTRITQPIKLICATDSSDECTAQKALEIERNVWSEPAGLLQPWQEILQPAKAGEFSSRKNVHVIDTAIATQQWRPFRIDNPGDSRVRVATAKQGHCGQRVDDIA
jgi:hypothetical protein